MTSSVNIPIQNPMDKKDPCLSLPGITITSAEESTIIKGIKIPQRQASRSDGGFQKCNSFSDSSMSTDFSSNLCLKNLSTDQISKANIFQKFLQSFADCTRQNSSLYVSYRFCRSLPDLIDYDPMASNNAIVEDIADSSKCSDEVENFNVCGSDNKMISNYNLLSIDTVAEKYGGCKEFSPRSDNSKYSRIALCASDPSSFTSDNGSENNSSCTDEMMFWESEEDITSLSALKEKFQQAGNRREIKRCLSLGAHR